MSNELERTEGSPPPAGRWVKILVTLWGGALLLPAIPLFLGFCCLLEPLGDTDALNLGLAALVAVGLYCGGTMLLAGSSALAHRPPRPLRMAPLWGLMGGFVLSLAIGLGLWQIEGGVPVLSPWFIVLAAAFPPLAAVTWAADRQPGQLTRRRAGVAFAAGATVSVPLAVVLELLIPYTIVWLLLELGEPVRETLEGLVSLLAGGEVARAVTSPGFLLALFALALVAPLVEEFVKPVVVLPLLKGLGSQREAFLLGTLAGAGFAALENIVYALFGGDYWAGIAALRALGAAVHPLGAGLTTLGWHALLNRQPGAGRRWLLYYAVAVWQHALWNGGQVVWLALASAMFFGPQPPETDVLGINIAVGLLALLALEGAALWVGLRTLTGRLESERAPALPEIVMSDRTVALWAVICLATLLPVGLGLLHGLWR
ncbi:MAG: PrsW family intramembrane metalloprotease [Anaerolineae bacterium]|nr:PrsW family intramembrane metalloprotease [Anaerolineae bacterium]